MKIALVVASLLLTASVAVGQYQTSFTKGAYDLTQNVKTGLNVWKALPGGGTCQPGSGSMSFGGHLYYCVGTDGNPWKHDRRTHSWSIDTALGASGMSALAVKNASAIYAIWTSSACPAPDKMLWYWTPSAGWNYPGGTYPAGTQKCLSHVSVGGDGFMAGITQGSGEQNILWKSQDGGKTWNQWASGYTYVSMWNQNEGCAISTSGAIYSVGLNGSPTNLGGSNFVGCVYGDRPFVLMAWDASGHVSMNDEQTGAWDTVSGLSASHIAGINKYMIVALDQNYHPSHWNIKAKSITATTTGTWNSGCPSPGNPCHPTTQHRSTVKAWFSSGHGINGSKSPSVETIVWNGAMNNQFFDVNPGCDPLWGVPTDVECIVESSGGETCLQSGAGIGGVPQPPTPSRSGVSHDYQTATSYFDRIGPQLDYVSPTGVQYWMGTQELSMSDGCIPGSFPTCPGPDPFGYDAIGIGPGGYADALWQLNNGWPLENPFLSEESWDNSGLGGTVQCLGDQITWGTSGNFDDRNFVPTCD